MEPRQGNITLAAAQDKVEIDSRGLDTLAIQVVGSMSATLLAEGTVDGKNWVTLNLTTYGAGLATSITAAGLFFANISGFISVRVRCSAWTSGTPTIAIQAISGGILFFNKDSNGNLLFSLNTALAGEDITNDVTKVEMRYSKATITTATTTLVKPGVGFIHTLEILGGTLGAITAYDNTAASGTPILPTFTPTATVPCPPIILDQSFNVGLTIVTAAATIIAVSYR